VARFRVATFLGRTKPLTPAGSGSVIETDELAASSIYHCYWDELYPIEWSVVPKKRVRTMPVVKVVAGWRSASKALRPG
jgi:hypothetical protein